MILRAITFAALLMVGPDLEQEYKATTDESRLAMLTIIARYPDGRPVRGEIACSGNWYKHQDGDVDWSAPSLPFMTDSRGAIVMNPHMEDSWIMCWAEKDGLSGSVTISFDDDPTGVYEIVLGRT